MNKLFTTIFLFLSIFIVSCSSNATRPSKEIVNNEEDISIILGEKPLTKNIPSLSKYVLTGTSTYSAGEEESVQPRTYSVLERLYSTVWFKSEKTYDDGIIETETEFIFFDKDSKMCKREYDNGIKDGNDDFSVLTVVDSSIDTSLSQELNMNAIVVKNTDIDDNEVEYQGYYLYSQNSLFVVEGNNIEDVKEELQMIVYNPPKYMKYRYMFYQHSFS